LNVNNQNQMKLFRNSRPVVDWFAFWVGRIFVSGYQTIGCIAEQCFDGSHGIHPVDPAATIHFVAERRLKPAPANVFKRRSATRVFHNIRTGG
jgi:hypothetical protein